MIQQAVADGYLDPAFLSSDELVWLDELHADEIPPGMPGLNMAWNGQRTVAVRLAFGNTNGMLATVANTVFREALKAALAQHRITWAVSGDLGRGGLG